MKPKFSTAIDWTLFALAPLVIYLGCYFVVVKRVVVMSSGWWHYGKPPGTRLVVGADFGKLPPEAFSYIYQLDRTYIRPGWWTAIYYPLD